MCIIVVKPKHKKLQDKALLERCFKSNKDGAGYMFVNKENDVVEIKKGFMNFDGFYKAVCEDYKKYKLKDQTLVMHFRIGTSGTNSKENTHPYCISSDYRDLHKTKVRTSLGMVHNGVINQYTPIDNKHNTNDTQEFIMKYIAPLYHNYKDFYRNNYILEGLGDITNSRLVFLNGNEELFYVGDFEEEKGVKYSNGTYKSYSYFQYGNWWKYDYPRVWDTESKSYLDDKEYEYLPVREKVEVEDELDYNNLEKLDSKWYISNNYDNWSKVGLRDLYIDITNFDLYELTENNTMFKIGENTFVFDENYEDVY